MSDHLVFLAPRGFGIEPEFKKVRERIETSLDTTFNEVPLGLKVHLFVGCSYTDMRSNESRGDLGEISCFQIKTHDFLSYLRQVFSQVIESDYSPNLIIAGDPRLGFLAAYLLKLRFSTAKIQTQFHGNSDSFLGGKRLPRWLQRYYLNFILRNSLSIRMVSSHQKETFECLAGRSINNVVIAPVPFQVVAKRPPTIGNAVGFVGRIHGERGLHRWLDTASEISRMNNDVEFLVIGDGPERDDFLMKLNTLTRGRVRFLGWLSRSDLQRSWGHIGVLLSTAEQESYGVTLREALCSGLHVVAFENAASRELQSKFMDYVHVSQNTSELARMVVEFLDIQIPQKELTSIHNIFQVANLKSSIQLGQSWAKLINTH
jgi:glycosyltransferase involved in cell wall biosynthesis